MEIKTVAVLGAGTMGHGIAQVCAQAGYRVYMRDIEQRFIDNGMKGIEKSLGKFVEKGKISEEEKQAILGRIIPTLDLEEACKEADVIIEAIIENPDVKKKVFQEIDAIAPPHAILASNTSSISITLLAAATKRPEKVIGLHFFNPPPIMRLIEIIRGEQTSEETFKIAENFSQTLGKVTVSINEAPGFAVNRILMPALMEAVYALQEGLGTKEDIDTAIKLGLNWPMGPFELMDFIGLDVCLYVANVLYEEFQDSKYRAPYLLKKKVMAGHLGRKTGKGWYDYSK